MFCRKRALRKSETIDRDVHPPLPSNVKGVWWGCKYAILAMRNNPADASKGLRQGGAIINTASFGEHEHVAYREEALVVTRRTDTDLCFWSSRQHGGGDPTAGVYGLKGRRSRNDTRDGYGTCSGGHSHQCTQPVSPLESNTTVLNLFRVNLPVRRVKWTSSNS